MKKTNGELDIMVENLAKKLEDHIKDSNEFRKEVMDAIKENTGISQKTLDQATKTNGRATALERWKDDEIMPVVKEYTKYKYIFIGIMILVSVCGTLFFNLYKEKFRRDLLIEVNSNLIKTLEDKYIIQIQ